MHPLVALAIVAALNAGVVYVVADDVLKLPEPLTGTQSAWLGLAVTVVPAIVFIALS
jgi:hypothetical protein